jgi:hypothetical protein
MSKLYNFYVKLDRADFQFSHYRDYWDQFEPKEEYTLGKQISLLLIGFGVAFTWGFVKLGEGLEKISKVFSVKSSSNHKQETEKE